MAESTDGRPWRRGVPAEVAALTDQADNTAAALQARQAKLRWLRDHPRKLPDPTLMRRRSAPTLTLRRASSTTPIAPIDSQRRRSTAAPGNQPGCASSSPST
jgi:hypothetical protein